MGAEADANLKALEIAHKLDMAGDVVFVDGRIEGFIFGQKVSERPVHTSARQNKP